MPEGQAMCNSAYHEDKQNLAQPYTLGAWAPLGPPKTKSRARKSGTLNRNTTGQCKWREVRAHKCSASKATESHHTLE